MVTSLSSTAMKKASIFDNFRAKQCTLIINESVLPDFHYIVKTKIEFRIEIEFKKHDILSLIHGVSPNKASESDGVSGQML